MASKPKRTFYIYCHTSPSGKRYIGQTCQKPSSRWSHGHGYRNNTHFSNAIEKYGWENFKHEYLCVVHYKSVADLFEQHYIAKYDTFNQDHGYNLTKGGGGTLGTSMTEDNKRKLIESRRNAVFTSEQRKHISETLKEGYASGRIPKPSMSEEARERMSRDRTGEGNPMYGKHHSPEAVASMIAKRTGLKKSDETRKRISESRYKSTKIKRRQVCQLDLDGSLIATYRSIKEASDATGLFASNIGDCCRKPHRTTGGYRWRYQDEYDKQLESAQDSTNE